jgi:hypothetical protein
MKESTKLLNHQAIVEETVAEVVVFLLAKWTENENNVMAIHIAMTHS